MASDGPRSVATAEAQPVERPTTGIEYVRCSLCGANDGELLFRAPVLPRHRGQYNRDEWDVVRCRRCGLIYLNPRPDSEAMANFYRFDDAGDMEFVQDWFIEGGDLQTPTWERLLRVLTRYCPSGRLLDVGCGAGTFLVRARSHGYDVAGQDVSPYFVANCRAKHSLTVYEGELQDLGLAPGAFDCVTSFDVIEHHPDPRRMLGEVQRLLKPGGVALITTHDIGNWLARRYGPRWRLINPIGHLTYFTRDTLAELMEACGLRVIRQGGLHTIDAARAAVLRNWAIEFPKLIVLRAMILGLYKPLAARAPALTRWRLPWRGSYLNHDRLMLRTGAQIIINDDMVLVGRKIG